MVRRAAFLALGLVVGLLAAGPSASADAPELVVQASFSGLVRSDYLGGPHLSIAAGPRSVILSSTGGIEVRAKDGAFIASATSGDLFAPVKHPQAGLGDLVVLFDHFSERFFIVVMDRIFNQQGCEAGPGSDSCLSHLLLAVSKTADPPTLTPSDWHLFSLDTTLDMVNGETAWNSNWNDWPLLGVTREFVAITAQQIPVWGDPYTDVRPFKVRVIEKAPLLEGRFPEEWRDVISPQAGEGFGWLAPALMFEDPGVLFLATSAAPGTCGFTIWGIEGAALEARTRWARTSSPLSCPDPLPGAPQPGEAAALLDTLGTTTPAPFAAYRDGSLWVTRTTSRDFGDGPVAAVHWAEIDVRSWPERVFVVQEGVIAEEGVFSFRPAIGVDAAGNAVLVFHRSGPDEFPSIYYTGRAESDPLGSMRPPRVLHAGTGSLPAVTDPPFHRYGVLVDRFVDSTGIGYDSATGNLWVLGQYGDPGLAFTTWTGAIGWSVNPTDDQLEVGEASPLIGIAPAPPPGGLTQVIVGTSDIQALIEAQTFDVESVWKLDIATQKFQVYVPGAPSFANTLTQLSAPDVVTLKRTRPVLSELRQRRTIRRHLGQ